MFATFRNACGAFGLCLLVSTTAQAEVLHYIELPELTGTFTHGQAPITAIVDLGETSFFPEEVLLEVTGTGTSGVSSTLGGFPAELLVSVNIIDDPFPFIPPTVIGPYGETPATFEVDTTPGDLVGDLDGGGGGGLIVIFPLAFEVVIASNPAYTDVTTPSTVDITNVSLTLAGDANECIPGDIGCDGFIGIDDLNIILGNWNLNVPPGNPLADVSGDGFVGVDDLNYVLGNWNAGTPPGLTGCLDGIGDDGCIGNGFIGINELNIVLGAWNQSVPPADPLADRSGDGFVGIDDLNWVLSRWNAGTPPAASTVPEPATLAVLGVLTLLPLRRRH